MDNSKKIAYLIAILLVILFIWAYFFKIDIVAKCQGEAISEVRNKSIQNLEGGIISEIFVKDGDFVKENQLLLKLSQPPSENSYDELALKLSNLEIIKLRLQAEIDNSSLKIDTKLKNSDFAKSQLDIFYKKRDNQKQSLSIIKEQIKQKESEIDEINSKTLLSKEKVLILKEKYELSRKLLEDKLTTKIEHLNIENELKSNENEIQALINSIQKIKLSIEESKAELEHKSQTFKKESIEELASIQEQILNTQEQLNSIQNQNIRSDIKAPIDGIVKNMKFFTIGGVVKSGEVILEIVPKDNLILLAKVKPIDRAYIRLNQSAIIRFEGYDFSRYGSLNGKVINIGADTKSEKDSRFYEILIKLEDSYIDSDGNVLDLYSGMSADISIKIGQKTVLDYIISPAIKLKFEAFGER